MREYLWYVHLIFWGQKRKYGEILRSAKIWAKSPSLFLALSWLYASINRKSSPIAPDLRSFVIVRISQIRSCNQKFHVFIIFLCRIT